MNKDVFFLSNIFPGDFTRGVTKKVFGQIKGLEENGYHVKFYTGYTENGAAIFNENGNIIYEDRFNIKNKLIRRITRNQLLKKTAADFLNNSGLQFGICYARYLFSDPAFICFLRVAKKKCEKVLVEAHSYPLYYAKCPQLYPVYVVDFIWNRQVKKYTDYVVSVSEKFDYIWGVKTIHVENSVDLDALTLKNQTKASKIRLLAVAYEWAPHGYDRIIKGIKAYYDNGGKEKIILRLVGTVMESTKKLIKDLNLEKYVHIVGKKFGNELDEIYDNSDIGVGSLASFRIGVKGIDRELKTREYIAKGLPYICSGNKDEESWYNLAFPENDSPIDINEVIKFYYKLNAIDNVNEKIRNEAKTVTWAYQFKKMLEVICSEESNS